MFEKPCSNAQNPLVATWVKFYRKILKFMNYFRMPTKELREELKKRGLKGYSSLRKIQMIEYLSTGIHPLNGAIKRVPCSQMRVKELREELKKRGLKRYSSLKKTQLIEYLSTGIHPLKNTQVFSKTVGGEIRDPSSEGIGYSPTLFGGTEKLPVNQIVSGDCINVMQSFPDGVFDCCITDPPFNMSRKKGLGWAFSSHVTMQEQWDIFAQDDYFQFTVDWITEVLRLLKTNGNLFIFGSFHCIFTIGFILQSLFNRRIISQLVWYKPNAQPNITCRMFTESTEFIIWVVNNESKKAKNWTFNYEVMKAMNNDKQMRNMWEIPLTKPSERKYGKHPSQKPSAVINRLILAGTNEGDLILDPFSGTGTTAVVAEQHKRKWIMIEKEDEYNRIAQKRVDELFSELFEDGSNNDW